MTLTYRKILAFWLPLAAMWLVMGIEQPLLSAVVARLPDPTLHLAAFGIAFSLALMVESPILQMLAAATALAENRTRYRQLLVLMGWAAFLLVSFHLFLAIPRVFEFIAGTILGVPEEVLVPAHRVFIVFTPFSALVGYRRLWQGVLIRYGFTSAVSLSMYIRLAVTTGMLLLPFLISAVDMTGSMVGSIGMMCGVASGTLGAWVLYRRHVHDIISDSREDSRIPWRELLRFYIPLSSTSILLLAARPLLTFGITRSASALGSLAAWPVVQAFLFLFTSVALSYQEAVIALLSSDPETRKRIRFFAVGIGLVLTGLFTLLSITGIANLWFRHVMALSEELFDLTVPAMVTLIPTAWFVTMKSWYRGALVKDHRTDVIARSALVNMGVLVTIVVVVPIVTTTSGTFVAALAWVAAMGIENIPLHRGFRRGSRS